MKMNLKSLLACVALSSMLLSCQKQDKSPATSQNGIPSEVINQIAAKGFNTEGVIAVNGGYVVEGDIFLSYQDLTNLNIGPDLRVGEEEQYHTTNLITGLPRTITISVEGLDPIWTIATDSAVARYNLLGMRLTFQRVSSGGRIRVVGHDLGGNGVLGQSSGFPNAAGNPPDSITLNNRPGTFGTNPSVQWLATIVAHEMGHTIGFRHTDYKNRKYSCGGIRYNEGKAGVGAIWIPGTPTGPRDPNSWMLACTDGSNRPFNPNDLIALNYLYH
ncbi:protease [Panacibacter ginsenosidivorans]|uniref:Protease n=1 Tax=Panacibacter ginsenosidivorans TaxID=1813871 RepID=A0A5B8V5B9_9BACT|nr:M57 family metalloprotease [Panacibacter ginsenosidivorans]QEC65911.1 protease [Panacibacter ginsenosidivorans]